MSERRIVTRFAPSPTGYLHIGGARTALFNYLYAKKYGGKFILRIEDTDMARNSEEASAAILSSLSWLGLDWDEGPFYQSRRLDIYSAYAKKLLAAGRAYRCFCTAERLESLRAAKTAEGGGWAYDRKCASLDPAEAAGREAAGEKCVTRFRIPEGGGGVSFDDMVHGAVSFQHDALDDFIIIKSDGMPTYNFAVAVDDHEMGVTHVIRGDDHISNTPKQLLIFGALGVEPPVYGHVPMILGQDKTKLSKRHGATSLGWYEEAGFVKEAAINYLALLGWAYDDKTEFFTTADLIEKFSEKKFGRTPAVFDIKKMEFFNQAHLKAMDLDAKTTLVRGYAKKYLPDMKINSKYDGHEYFKAVTAMAGDRLRLLGDIKNYAWFMFTDEFEYPAELTGRIIKDHGAPAAVSALEAMAKLFRSRGAFEPAGLEAALRGAQIGGLNFSKLVFLLRSALAAQTVSPGIFEVMCALGPERSLERIARLSAALAAAGTHA